MNQPQAMQSIRQTLAAAKTKQAKIFNALERDAMPSQPKAAADYESPEYEPTQGDAEIQR